LLKGSNASDNKVITHIVSAPRKARRIWSGESPGMVRAQKSKGSTGDIWCLNEVFIIINGERHYLRAAVDNGLLGSLPNKAISVK